MSELMKKQEMTEEDIKLQYITLAIEGAGWDKLKQIKMEYNFTDGRVIVREMLQPEARESAQIICFITSPIFRWLLSRRKIINTVSIMLLYHILPFLALFVRYCLRLT